MAIRLLGTKAAVSFFQNAFIFHQIFNLESVIAFFPNFRLFTTKSMKPFHILTVVFLLIFSVVGKSQQANISGLVEDENGRPLKGVSVVILGKQTGTSTNDSGRFSIQIRPKRATALIFSYVGFNQTQRNFNLNPGENETITVTLQPGTGTLQNVTVTNRKGIGEAGRIVINTKLSLINPAPIGGIENQLKIFVNSRSELSSQYEVRGGNYDENLVYVNDFEVFRPYLVRSGQQEGLSFINPELASNVNFYNGGFQARYGDKMSSVLDVEYKKPKEFHGSAYAGFLEQGFHVEGSAKSNRITYLLGVRNRSLRNLLGSQETKGNYVPNSADFQGQLTWQPNNKWLMELLGNLSSTRFTLEPEESKQTTSVFTPQFSSNLGLDIFFDGREVDKYSTKMVGLSATRFISKQFKLKGMLSYFQNKEAENINVAGSYLFGDRDFDKSSADFGQITNPLGAGVFLNYARNTLDVQVLNASLKGTLDKGNHTLQFGTSVEQNKVADKLNEFEYQDSAGYSLPNNAGPLQLFKSSKSQSDLNITRFTGYIQDNILFDKTNYKLLLMAGVRYNYNSLNNEFLVSPRAGISITPKNWKENLIFKASAGIYNQPPFYRELRRYDGSVNTDLKAQKSYQVSAGFDYAFKGLNRPMRLSFESYYKNMRDVVPYDIDNVRLRYFGNNSAKAYAYGAEARLFGELVKDAESWVSIGYMKTMENLTGDFYNEYYNAANELITDKTDDQVAVRTEQKEIGWLRRPTDRRVNFGLFFSDYLTTNKSFKVFLQTLYGTNLPYNIPGSTRYRNALEIPSYIRVDIGFSYQLLHAIKAERRSHSPFRTLDNMWLSFEVFNLLDRSNTISYALIKDFSNSTYAVPNRLTPRLINLKLIVRW
jgi:outer membrane receptor protein involved in Fe transport